MKNGAVKKQSKKSEVHSYFYLFQGVVPRITLLNMILKKSVLKN